MGSVKAQANRRARNPKQPLIACRADSGSPTSPFLARWGWKLALADALHGAGLLWVFASALAKCLFSSTSFPPDAALGLSTAIANYKRRPVFNARRKCKTFQKTIPRPNSNATQKRQHREPPIRPCGGRTPIWREFPNRFREAEESAPPNRRARKISRAGSPRAP